MAVGSTAVFAMRADLSGDVLGPVRTCIGCRGKAPAVELFRVVVVSRSPAIAPNQPAHRGDETAQDAVTVVPDHDRRALGRGAWLHPSLACVDQAHRRRAFARALRVPGPLDTTSVLAYLARTLD